MNIGYGGLNRLPFVHIAVFKDFTIFYNLSYMCVTNTSHTNSASPDNRVCNHEGEITLYFMVRY